MKEKTGKQQKLKTIITYKKEKAKRIPDKRSFILCQNPPHFCPFR
jgi:hypothetical protein